MEDSRAAWGTDDNRSSSAFNVPLVGDVYPLRAPTLVDMETELHIAQQLTTPTRQYRFKRPQIATRLPFFGKVKNDATAGEGVQKPFTLCAQNTRR